MNNCSTLELCLDTILPDEKIVKDVRRFLDIELSYSIRLEDEIISVPRDVSILMVTKAFFKEYVCIPFGTFRGFVTIGQIIYGEETGLLQAEYCFATAFYNKNIELVDVDFHHEFR